MVIEEGLTKDLWNEIYEPVVRLIESNGGDVTMSRSEWNDSYDLIRTDATPVLINPNTMPRINGKTFRCECRGNAFSQYTGNIFVCNSCGERYLGE